MAHKQQAQQYNTDAMTPDELGAIRVIVKEFINKIETVDNEIELLKQDRKDLVEEYKSKIDMKTLQLALKVIKLQRSVTHKDTFDLFIAALEDVE